MAGTEENSEIWDGIFSLMDEAEPTLEIQLCVNLETEWF